MNELFKKRRSVRKFTKKAVSDAQIKEILLAAMVAPSGCNRRPWDFVVVKDPATKKVLAQSGPWADFVDEASVAIAIIGDEQKSWLWLEDCSLAAGQIYLEATNQGLGACWAHIRGGKTVQKEDAEDFVRKVLGIPQTKRVLCLMAIGDPAESPPQYSEKDFNSSKVHQEKW